MNKWHILPLFMTCCILLTLPSCISIKKGWETTKVNFKKGMEASKARSEMVTCPGGCWKGIRPDGKRPCDLCGGMGEVTRAQAEEYAR